MKELLRGKKRGVATLEILIAFALVALSMSAVIMLVFGNQTASADVEASTEALAQARTLLEEARAHAAADFDSLVSISPALGNGYEKSLEVTTINSDTKEVKSAVAWEASGRPLAVTLTTLVTRPLAPGACALPEGDWSAPQVYAYADFSNAAGASAVAVEGGVAYVTADTAANDDFYVYDAHDITPHTGALALMGHLSTGLGLTSVVDAGTYAYVTASSQTAQLLVIDVSHPSALSQASITTRIDLPASNGGGTGNSLFIEGNRLYLGLTKSSTGNEFYIFDISDPAHPVQLGPGFEVNGAVNRIVVRRGVAYLATAANQKLLALDVSAPDAIVPIGSYTSSALTGQSIALGSDTLYFGRSGSLGNPKLMAFSLSDFSAPRWSMNMGIHDGVYDAILRGAFLFVTSHAPDDGFQIWDISDKDATHPPARVDTAPLLLAHNAPAGATCYGNLFFAAQEDSRALIVIGPRAS